MTALIQCANCGRVEQATKHGRCSFCGSDAVTLVEQQSCVVRPAMPLPSEEIEYLERLWSK